MSRGKVSMDALATQMQNAGVTADNDLICA
jgi:hypothetical protein